MKRRIFYSFVRKRLFCRWSFPGNSWIECAMKATLIWIKYRDFNQISLCSNKELFAKQLYCFHVDEKEKGNFFEIGTWALSQTKLSVAFKSILLFEKHRTYEKVPFILGFNPYIPKIVAFHVKFRLRFWSYTDMAKDRKLYTRPCQFVMGSCHDLCHFHSDFHSIHHDCGRKLLSDVFI